MLVVGGGPAGACAAALFARAGSRVVLVDRAHFPRAKACAEIMSPEASRVLDRLGVLSRVEAEQPVRISGMRFRAPDGTVAEARYGELEGYHPFRADALALPRTTLDSLVLETARIAGVEVHERAQATDVVRDEDGRVVGAVVREGAQEHSIGASLVVGADGLRSIVARRLGLARRSLWPRRLGLVAHLRGVRDVGGMGEMHVERDGFVGIVSVGKGVVNASLVIPARRAREIAGDPAGFHRRWLAEHPHLAPRFEDAVPTAPVRVTGPFASRATRAWAGGAALVGDAADFFDPITGEGIHAALRGAELLVDTLTGRHWQRDPATLDAALREYDTRRRALFSAKWRMERIVGLAVALAPLANRAARVLAARRDLADMLLGAAGGYVPHSQLLTPQVLFTIFLRAPRPA